MPNGPASRLADTDDGLEVRLGGRADSRDRDLARAVIGQVLARHRIPPTDARVRLTTSGCAAGPALVQVNLRVCGTAARVQVAGGSVDEAIAVGASRLDRQIHRLLEAGRPWPWPDPERRILGMPGRGRIVRRKTVRLQVCGPLHAAAVMAAMDYDVHLFTDAETGEDAIVYRAGHTGLRLARQRSMHPPSHPATTALTVNCHRILTHTVDEAGERLAEGWLPYVFFTDRDSGRGSLLYRRYDGDLGLIQPLDEA